MARDKKKIYVEVPVSELPPANGYYNVICDYPAEMGLIHWHKDTGWQNGFYNDRVTYWLKAIEISTPTLHSFEELKIANSYLSSLLDDFLADKPKDNWISVEERLPKDLQPCIICYGDSVQHQIWEYDKDAGLFRFVDGSEEFHQLACTEIKY